MNVKSVRLNKNVKFHFFSPDFDDDVAVVKARKGRFGWEVEPLFKIHRQHLLSIVVIENTSEVTVPYEQTVVDFYSTHRRCAVFRFQLILNV